MIRGMRSHIIFSHRFCKIQGEHKNYEGIILLFDKDVNLQLTLQVFVNSDRNKRTYFLVQ